MHQMNLDLPPVCSPISIRNAARESRLFANSIIPVQSVMHNKVMEMVLNYQIVIRGINTSDACVSLQGVTIQCEWFALELFPKMSRFDNACFCERIRK